MRAAARPPKSLVREWFTGAALALCLTLVLVATMWPTPLDQGYEGSIDRLLAVLHRNGVPEWFGYDKLEFSANVLMFVPLGFLLSLLLPAKVWWLALLICPGLSIAIELAQAALLSSRFATVSDVVANSIGAIIGSLVAVSVRALVHSRDQKIVARALWERNGAGPV
ncbi:VanZ family protein [Compostimonas suwonensis]|uniref:VanZ like protein n=1 Tax=Compostimonas suwonensis TaxID=1048394 RepID=A0A2M9C5H2_9MICO|nr:VanZ family protein [Compostimonas suwonensis]PJJ65727.1 VanZ like protein [Compostimonas suwonensis]